MPLIIGYMIGKVIGNLIVSIITLAFRLLHLLAIACFYVLKYALMGAQWMLRALWKSGVAWYDNYKLNLR